MAPRVDLAIVAEVVRLHGEGLTNAEIARAINRQHQYVGYHLKRLGLSPNRSAACLTPEAGIMAKIDSWAKAYTLGFLSADGCVSGHRCVEVFLQATDTAVLEYIRSVLRSQAVIESRRAGRHVRMRLSGRGLVADLATHGVVPRKSLTATWPETVPDEWRWAFVLGYFDGDGSVGIYQISYQGRQPIDRPTVAVLSSWPFANKLREFLASQGIRTFIGDGCASGVIAKIATQSWQQAAAWLTAMYRGAEFRLERKQRTASEILAHPKANLVSLGVKLPASS